MGQVEVLRLRCKSWQCEYCAAKNREMWRSHLKKRIAALAGEWWFVTVTAHEGNRHSFATLANLRRGLDLLFKRMRKIWKGLEYVRVYEKHRNGGFHAHMVVSGLSPRVAYRKGRNGVRVFSAAQGRGQGVLSLKTWFKKSARAVHMGYMVDVQKLDGVRKTINYVCKYFTKEAQNFHVPHLRRIQTSAGIGAANARKEGQGWRVDKYIWQSDVMGKDVYDLNLKMTIKPAFWERNYTYPVSAQA